MGFIENLRRQKTEQDARTKEETARLAREATKKNQEQANVENYHRSRIMRAKDFLVSSAFPRLAKELHDIYPEIRGVDEEHKYWEAAFQHWPIRDEDSVLIGIILRDKYISHGMNGDTYMMKQEGTLIAIESSPSGILTVHGRSSTRLSLDRWSEDIRVQEDALEEAYRRPKIIRYWSLIPKQPNYW